MAVLLLLLGAMPALVVLFWLLQAMLERLPVSGGLQQRAVLITGCDSGFGFQLALRCLRARLRVFAACLTEQGIQMLRSTALEQGLPVDELLEAFELDIRSDASVAGALALVEQKLGPRKGLHALINNAGVHGNAGWDDWLVPKDYEDTWQVNTLGTIRVTQAFKRLIIRECESRIIIMSSGCGRVALPCLGPYNVSKFGVEAYADTIRTELILFGVKVSILEPGFFRTPFTDPHRSCAILERVWGRAPDSVRRDYGMPFYEYSRKYVLSFLDPAKLNPRTDLVVDAYWHAISSAWPRRRYYPGRDGSFLFHPMALLPAEVQDLFFRLLQTVERTPFPDSSLMRGHRMEEAANGKNRAH